MKRKFNILLRNLFNGLHDGVSDNLVQSYRRVIGRVLTQVSGSFCERAALAEQKLNVCFERGFHRVERDEPLNSARPENIEDAKYRFCYVKELD